LGIGLGLGAGLSLLLELQDSSFRDVAEVEAYLGVPVICAISNIRLEKDIKSDRRKAILWWTFLSFTVLLLLGAMAYLYKTGRIII